VSTIENLIRDGDLNVRYAGSKRVVPASELLAYIEALPYDRP
jgi:hypothetical protein